jgi:hypothetical protein
MTATTTTAEQDPVAPPAVSRPATFAAAVKANAEAVAHAGRRNTTVTALTRKN